MGWQTSRAVSSMAVATVPGELFPQACGTRLWVLAWDTGPADRASFPQGRAVLVCRAAGLWLHPTGPVQPPRVHLSLNLWGGVCGQEGAHDIKEKSTMCRAMWTALPTGLILILRVREGWWWGGNRAGRLEGEITFLLGIKQGTVCHSS